jgi:hypothetical protein
MEVLLKTFISETIKEIIDGVIEAQKHVVAVKIAQIQLGN